MNKHFDVMYTNPCVYKLLGLFSRVDIVFQKA